MTNQLTMTQWNNDPIKLVFFGTHDFAAEILQGLIDNPQIQIDLVITQPDKPIGRKQVMQKPAVKILAEKNGLNISQPDSLRTFDFTTLRTFDLGVCTQYGLIIPQHILDIPKHGIINVHTSLLPKYRGASPVQTTLMNGEIETGITIMKMDAGMDTGPILLQKSLKIDPDDTYTTLSQKLAKTAIFALTEALEGYIQGTVVPRPQDNSKASYTKILTREDGRIDWTKLATEIYNQYRGLTPWPGVWTIMNGKRLKLLKIKPINKKLGRGTWDVEQDKIFIGCGEGSIEILWLQLEGAKIIDAKTFINGHLGSFQDLM